MKKLSLLLIIMTSMIGCKTEKEAEVPSQLTSYFKNSSLPSAIMGSTTKDGKMNWNAFGPSTWEATDTVTENHIFRIASMTKAITSVAALKLVEQGLLSLDEPLKALMPEMDTIPILIEGGELIKSKKAITLRHLLTHTSGFGYGFTSSRLSNFKPVNWQYDDNPRLFEPGTSWNYGTSTDWVGKIIEKVSGQDLETYIQENITGPLKMNSTFFNVPDSLTSKIVSWGSRDSMGFEETQRISQKPVTSYSGGGGLFSSPNDYLAFLKCLLKDGEYDNGRILKAETVKMMFENQLPANQNLVYDIPEGNLISSTGDFPDESDKHGLAWAIEDNDDETVRPKGAAYWAGIGNSYFTIDKKNKLAVVYFTQFLPFNDKESYDFYRLYEKEVYSRINSK